jgi:SAM-dependent methyltransferase
MIVKVAQLISQKYRTKRAVLFHRYLHPTQSDRILDLGSEDGSSIAKIIPFRENVFIADINQEMLARGQQKYGFKTVLLDENGMLPFEDNYFDIVYCNSVIEHVTIDKKHQWSLQSQKEFTKVALERQKQFANEIRRIGRSYFVQTPCKNFIFESHTWLPLLQFLPRPVLIRAIRFLNKWWVKRTTPDWNLLTVKQMKAFFPEAVIVEERILGLTKSLIAVGRKGYSRSMLKNLGWAKS